MSPIWVHMPRPCLRADWATEFIHSKSSAADSRSFDSAARVLESVGGPMRNPVMLIAAPGQPRGAGVWTV